MASLQSCYLQISGMLALYFWSLQLNISTGETVECVSRKILDRNSAKCSPCYLCVTEFS